jgi:hypothetical protein
MLKYFKNYKVYKMTYLRLAPRSLILIFVFTSIILLLLSPILNSALPMNQDFLGHLSAIIQAKMALAEGQFPLRVAPLPLPQNDWRYPNFQFYAPTSYMLAGFIYRWLTPSSPFDSYKIIMACALLLGGIYMYRLAYEFVKSRYAALLAATAYLLTPYFIIIINQLGAFNEVVAYGIVPSVLYYTWQRYLQRDNDKYLLQTALVWYLLATTHLITFVCTSFFAGLFFTLVTLQRRAYWKNLCGIIFAYAFSCVLACWYLGPVFLFSKYLSINESFNNTALFFSNTPSLLNLLSPGGMTSQGISTWPGMVYSVSQIHPNVGVLTLINFLVCAYVWLKKYKSGKKDFSPWVAALLIIFAINFFLVWTPLNFWQWLPAHFQFMQYSWRMLGQLAWIGALLFAWGLNWFFARSLDARRSLLILFLIAASVTGWLRLPVQKITEPFDISQHMLNNEAYLINASGNAGLIDNMDTMLIASKVYSENLTLNKLKPLIVPALFLNAGEVPQFVLKGTVPDTAKPLKIKMLLDNKLAGTYALTSGPFSLNLPLKKQKTNLQVKFQIESENKPPPIISLDKILINGFIKADTVIDVNSMMPYCHQQKATTLCELFVPASVHLLELPIFFYPELLSITLNGKRVAYDSVFYENHLIAGITPQTNMLNSIRIQFKGLDWANTVSGLSWQLWVLFLIFITLRSYTNRKQI